ncbi:MAG: hypothetical protein AB8G95_11520 [Anaerolineae bacterium]
MLALIVVELGLRLFVESPPFSYGYDEDWGYYPAEGTFLIWGSEGYGINYFADHGEQQTISNEGQNIVVLGDSHTESHQVAYTDNFVSVAESILMKKGLAFNLRNHGKAYSSVADYVYLAPVVKGLYSPEVVVLQLSVQDFFKHEVYDKNKINHFVSQKDELKLVHNPPPFNDHWLGQLMQNTVLLVQGTKRQRLFSEASKPPAQAGGESAPIALDVIDTQLEMLREAYADVEVIIVLLPYAPTVQGDQFVSEEVEFTDLLEHFSKIEEWKIVDPSGEFTELMETSGRLPRGFSNSLPGIGHLNEYGHQIVGEILAAQIEQITVKTTTQN